MSAKTLFLTFNQRAEMLAQVQASLPEEACGLAGGHGNRLNLIVPVANRLHSPVRFQMDPVEMVNAFQNFDKAGLELAAIYHSHPQGPPNPSETDLAEFFYPGVAYLIWSPAGRDWQLRGFNIEDGQTTELELIFGVTTYE